MQIIDRYIASAFARNFGLAVLSLTCLYLFQSLMGDLLDHAYPADQNLVYNILQIPQIFVQMTPPAVLLATVLTLSGLNRTNELTACYSIGVGLNRVMTVILGLVFVISCATLVLQDSILPPIFRKRETYLYREMKHKQDFFLDLKRDKIWYRSKNIIYNLRTFDPKTKTIHGMSVYTFDESFNLKQVIDAETAEFTSHGWRLLNGNVTVFDGADAFPLSKKFKEKELLIAESPRDFEEIEKEVDGLRILELKQYIAKTKASGIDTKSYEVKLWSRFSLSFVPMVMCVLGVPFSLRGRREGGLAKDLILCLVVTFFYWLFYSVGLSLGTNGALPPVIAAWTPSLVFAALAAFLVTRKQA